MSVYLFVSTEIGAMMILTRKKRHNCSSKLHGCPQAWARVGGGGTCPRKCSKVLVVLQMLSKVSASGSFSSRLPAALCPWTPQRTSVLHISSRLTPGKKILRVPMASSSVAVASEFPIARHCDTQLITFRILASLLGVIDWHPHVVLINSLPWRERNIDTTTYLHIVMIACWRVERTLEIKPQKRESDDAALWLTNNVLALLVVWVRVRVVRWRYVARLCDVHSAASWFSRTTAQTRKFTCK